MSSSSSSPALPPAVLPEVPVTPSPMRNQSSTGSISSLFKDLLGRSRSSTYDIPPASTNSTSAQGIFTRRSSIHTVPRHLRTAPPDTADPRNARNPPLTRPSHDGDDTNVPPIRGGPPELSALLDQLSPKASLPSRIDATRRLSKMLSQYQVEGVWAVWILTQECLLKTNDQDANDAAFELLARLVQLPSLSSTERHNFVSLISSTELEQASELQFQLLEWLTNGGRNIGAAETKIAPLLIRLLDKSHEAAQKTSSVRKDTDLNSEHTSHVSLQRVIRFIVDLFKFNSQLLSDKHIEQLLEKVLHVSRHTTRKAHLRGGITVVEALIIYAELPRPLLKQCLELLCSVCNRMPMLDDLHEQSKQIIINLFYSHAAPAALCAFIDILNGELDTPNQRSNVLRGAVNVLADMVFHPRAAHLQELPLSLLLPALTSLIPVEKASWRASETLSDTKSFTLDGSRSERLSLESDICSIIWRLLLHEGTDNKYTRQLFQEHDWSALLEIVQRCAANVPDTAVPYGANLNCEAPSSHADGEADGRDRQKITNPSMPLRSVLLKLFEIRNHLDIIQRQDTMAMLVRLGPKLPDDVAKGVIQHYEDERLLQPPSEGWEAVWQVLLDAFFRDKRRSVDLRASTMRVIIGTYDHISFVLSPDAQITCAKSILEHINEETDPEVLTILTDAAVNFVAEASSELVDVVMDMFRIRLDSLIGGVYEAPSAKDPMFGRRPMSPTKVLTKALICIFIRTFSYSAWKSLKAYKLILRIAGARECETDARLSAIQFLLRLRSDASFALRINVLPDGESMAAILCRTADTVAATQKDIGTPDAENRTHGEDKIPVHQTLVGAAQYTLSRSSSRACRDPVNLKLSQPHWMYQEQEELPEGLPDTPSDVLYTEVEGAKDISPTYRQLFPSTLWMETVIHILQNSADWEVLSYLLAHLGAQLCNHAFWASCVPQLRLLRSVICDQIRNGTMPEAPISCNVKRADVAVCYFHMLTMLVSYHRHFEKSEQDDMVRSLYLGIGSWDRTSKWCIHALTICCHEIPDSTTKHLQNVVQKMSQIITQPHIAIHILEFLTHLVRLPDLYVNFRDDEFKMVFGVCFRYLQYVRDQQERSAGPPSTRAGGACLKHSTPLRDTRDPKVMEQQADKPKPADILPQYVHALAYHVITFWFMALKLEERAKFVPWIINKLVHTDRSGRETLEEQALITIDMLHSRAYTDRDETAYQESFSTESDGEVSRRSWVVGGEMVLTLETAARTGITQIVKRRPSYTGYGIYRPHLIAPPRHQVPLLTGLAADAFYTSSYVGVLPEDIFQGFFAPVVLLYPDVIERSPWIKLPNDDATRRSIAMLDRASTVDSHRVGVVFIGEGQDSEEEILANVMGSVDYTVFVEALGEGKLVRLKGTDMNTQGLDREFDSDGTHAVCWRDRVVEIVFHVASMMPTNLETDPRCINKKKHIGNDFVNIVFNNSGLPFRFDTFPSQFNYVYIVITPEARMAIVDTRDGAGLDRFYTVQVFTQPGFPEVSPASQPKVISGKGLPAYTRMLALNASVFCQVWASRHTGEYISSWRSRLREIKRLWDRHYIGRTAPPTSTTGPNVNSNAGVLHRHSAAAVLSSEGISLDMERQNSAGSRI